MMRRVVISMMMFLWSDDWRNILTKWSLGLVLRAIARPTRALESGQMVAFAG